jgi:hypothetical protein
VNTEASSLSSHQHLLTLESTQKVRVTYPAPALALGKGLSFGSAVSTSTKVSSWGKLIALPSFRDPNSLETPSLSLLWPLLPTLADILQLDQPMYVIFASAASHTLIWWAALLLSKPINRTTPSLHPTARN